MAIIEQIKTEIEGWLREYAEDSQFELGKRYGYKRLLSFLSTLESGKPIEGLEEELDKWRHDHFHGKRDEDFSGEYLERTSQLELASHFAQWGAEHTKNSEEKPVPADLEEAAGEYEKKHTYQRYDGGGLTPEYNATLAEAFIAGYNLCKERMMQEAVEGKVIDFRYVGEIDYASAKIVFTTIPKLKEGDKVRIIIVKEDSHE